MPTELQDKPVRDTLIVLCVLACVVIAIPLAIVLGAWIAELMFRWRLLP